MAKPWERYANQGSGISATPLPRHPDDVARENREREEKNREEAYDRGDRTFDEAADLRKEFNGLPAVAEYNVALGTYNSALRAKPTAQGDQSLITAYAKMLDPGSVVRGEEFATTASTEGMLNQVKARLAKEFGWEEGGMLTPEGRQAVRGEMRNLVVNRFKPAYEGVRQQYEFTAREFGVDPAVVIGQHVETRFPEGLLAETSAANSLAEAGSEIKLEGVPPAYQQAYEAFVRSGDWTPEQYATFRSQLDKTFFPDAADQTDTYLQEGARILEGVQQGSPLNLTVPGVETEMGMVEGALNSAAQSPWGAFAANMGNAGAFGLPAALSGAQDELGALRDQQPVPSFFGELAGGVTGTLGAGAGMGTIAKGLAPGGLKSALANPITADAAFGATYGATQDADDPFRGAFLGTGAALGGGVLGNAVGKAMPGLFARGAVKRADESVPSIDDLKTLANEQYTAAEAAGEIANPEATTGLLDSTRQILAGEGRISPKGNLIDTDTPVTRAYNLINDFGGGEMTPTQAGSVRKVLGDGLRATRDGAPDKEQRRLAGMMIDNFDQWSDPVLPGIADARETASRYLQAEEIAAARNIADANTSWFTQSGPENALRNSFRNLDRATIRGTRSFDDNVTGAIETVARGTPFSNAARQVGKLAPTGAIPIASSASLGTLASMSGLPGMAIGAGAAALGGAGRALATSQTKRAAEVAELMARGGLDYEQALAAATQKAASRANRVGGGMFGAMGSYATR